MCDEGIKHHSAQNSDHSSRCAIDSIAQCEAYYNFRLPGPASSKALARIRTTAHAALSTRLRGVRSTTISDCTVWLMQGNRMR